MGPDEAAFRADIIKAKYQAGCDAGLWTIPAVDWPAVIIGFGPAAAARRDLGLRFDLTGYPGVAPTSRPWDMEINESLAVEKWPTGERISQVFNPGWRLDALYMPFDRVALEGHGNWAQARPGYVWLPTSDITRYLRFIIDLLQEIESDAEDSQAA